MTDPKSNFSHLLKLGQIDGNLARLGGQKRQIQTNLAEKEKILKTQESNSRLKLLEFEERKERVRKEEKKLKEEKEQIVNRRKALSFLGDYKLQQAAEREIDGASQRLDVHEEEVLKMMEESDKAEDLFNSANTVLDGTKAELAALLEDAKGTLTNLEERISDYLKEREELVKGVTSVDLKVYEQVVKKFPMDPIVVVEKATSTCTGCFVKVGPQILVQVFKGEAPVKCPGCGRILFLQD